MQAELNIIGFERGVLDGDGYCPECGQWAGLYWFEALFGWDDDFSICEECAQRESQELQEQAKQERLLITRYGTLYPTLPLYYWLYPPENPAPPVDLSDLPLFSLEVV